jgi:hypothetical protein
MVSAFGFQQFREYIAETYPGKLAMPDEDAVWRYEKAVERFGADGAAGALMEALLALGIDAVAIRWHLANRGRHMASCIYAD